MRVAYVCADAGVPVFGVKGCSVHVQEMLRALTRQGADVVLVAARLGGAPPSDLASIPVHTLPALPAGPLAVREQAALDANSRLGALLRREGPFDLIYERYALWSYAGMAYAQAEGVPGLLEVNAPLIEEQATHRGLIDRASAERVAGRAFGYASALLAVSRGVAAYLHQYPQAWGHVHVVPNGVDPERFHPGVAPQSPDADAFTVGFVGSLKPWHGLEVLVDAVAERYRHAPRLRLLIVGDGPERAALEEAVNRQGLAEAVHFTGAVDWADVPGWITSMDVAVAPYPDAGQGYFSPLKVFEYMACGVPVVASRIGQLEDLIDDGVNGLLCPPGDAASLAHALDRLRTDATRRRRIGDAGRATILNGHTWEAVAQRVLRLATQRGSVRAEVDA